LATVALMSTVVVGGAVGSGSPLAGAAQTAFANTIVNPTSVAVDPLGNLYVADAASQAVYKIAPNGSGGFNPPTTIASGIVNPTGVAVQAGNVYVTGATSTTLTGTGFVDEITPSGGSAYNSPVAVISGLLNPTGVAVGSTGTIYVVQNSQGGFRGNAIASSERVQAFASNGSGGFNAPTSIGTWGGPLGFDRSLQPTTVAVDPSGKLFLANTYNVFEAAGINVRTISPINNYCGYQGGGVAVDSSGNVFFGCGGTVSELTPNGSGGFNPSAAVGSGSWQLTGVAIDSSGNIYASDGANGGLDEITPAVPDAPTNVTAVATNHTLTVSWDAMVSYPATLSYSVTDGRGQTCLGVTVTTCVLTGLTNGSTYVVVVTTTNALGNSVGSTLSAIPEPAVPNAPAIQAATITGDGSVQVSWMASTEDSSLPITYAVTSAPGTASCAPKTATLSCTVRGLANGTSYTFSVVATNATGPSSPSTIGPVVPPTQTVIAPGVPYPYGLATDSAGNVYAAVPTTGTVDKITPSGIQTAVATGLSFPYSVALDSRGNIYISDVTAQSVFRVTPGGVRTTVATGLAWLGGLTVSPAGDIFVVISGVTGCGGCWGPAPNTGMIDVIRPIGPGMFSVPTPVVSGLDNPQQVAVDGNRNLYVTGAFGNYFDKIPFYRIGGYGAPVAFGTGLQYPVDATVDAAGNIYVVDRATGQVDEITPQGVQFVAATDLASPNTVAVDTAGNMYVSAQGQILKFGFRINSGLPAATHAKRYEPVTLVVAGVTPSTAGGPTKVAWAVASGVNSPLPRGMKLSPQGVLSGTPSSTLTAGNYQVNVQVTQTVNTRVDGKMNTSTSTVRSSLPILIK